MEIRTVFPRDLEIYHSVFLEASKLCTILALLILDTVLELTVGVQISN